MEVKVYLDGYTFTVSKVSGKLVITNISCYLDKWINPSTELRHRVYIAAGREYKNIREAFPSVKLSTCPRLNTCMHGESMCMDNKCKANQ